MVLSMKDIPHYPRPDSVQRYILKRLMSSAL